MVSAGNRTKDPKFNFNLLEELTFIVCGTFYTDLHTSTSVQPCEGQPISPLKEES